MVYAYIRLGTAAPGVAPGGFPPDVFNFLGASIARQADALEDITTTNKNTLNFQRKKESTKKDRFNKFHPSVKQMILFASLVDIEDIPTVPEDSYDLSTQPPRELLNRNQACSSEQWTSAKLHMRPDSP